MGMIKDLVDLLTQLDKSIKDRKTRELLLPIKEKILEVQKEHFRIERENAEAMDRLNAKHAEAMSDLDSSHAEVLSGLDSSHSKEVANLHTQISTQQKENDQFKQQIDKAKSGEFPRVFHQKVRRRP